MSADQLPGLGRTADGGTVFVKVLSADHRAADLMYRVYRWLRFRHAGDRRPFISLRRSVEHEAFAALQAGNRKITTPRFLVDVGGDGIMLAYEAVAGRSLDGVAAAEISDGLLRQIWDLVAHLHEHGIAHRDLRVANLMLADDGTPHVIDFGFAELSADFDHRAGTSLRRSARLTSDGQAWLWLPRSQHMPAQRWASSARFDVRCPSVPTLIAQLASFFQQPCHARQGGWIGNQRSLSPKPRCPHGHGGFGHRSQHTRRGADPCAGHHCPGSPRGKRCGCCVAAVCANCDIDDAGDPHHRGRCLRCSLWTEVGHQVTYACRQRCDLIDRSGGTAPNEVGAAGWEAR